MHEEHEPYVIVVGVDYSDTAKLALEHALTLASQRAPAEVHVVHVLSVTASGLASPAIEAVRAHLQSANEAADQLKSYVTGVIDACVAQGATPPARVALHLRLEAPAQQVAQLAADLQADIVVVGTQGRQGISRLVLGSVAEGTVRLAPCPVLVMRAKSIPTPVPQIEPPCPRCLQTRNSSPRRELWCEQHRERHGQRHTYHQSDRASVDTNLPLTFRA
jgi:nucleotide-binding universal stress UspA family protein